MGRLVLAVVVHLQRVKMVWGIAEKVQKGKRVKVKADIGQMGRMLMVIIEKVQKGNTVVDNMR